ncbi:MAG TPA: hypothetical protein VIF62_16820 [Labilithrix sp.]
MRRPDPITDLADLLEPEPEPVSDEPTQDFAFAPTVHMNDVPEDEFPPPSGPIYVNEPDGQTQCMTPMAFPMPPPSEDATLDTRARIAFSRVRHAFRRSIDELRELWLAACEAVGGDLRDGTGDPLAQAALVARRARVVWSFWEWDRADVFRAAAIGSAVFLAVATVGAAVVVTRESAAPPLTDDGVEVRVPRTIDQHTPRAFVLRTKR